ncbi:hypothetical protein [Burkholderia cepacia]|uniref:hypothetical protein n=1 Tax=Burkholderia cepacia TaxID=292 RepID=UPI000A71A960|nr:hypothetical protein [Burkholderia cepacia]
MNGRGRNSRILAGGDSWKAATRAIVAALSFVGVMPGASAECRLAASTVIMCQGAGNAALAYKAYGMNVKKIDTSYTREILHQSYCATITDPKRTITFGRLQSGRVATPDGWVDVTFVGWVHDGLADTRYVAAPYLRGTCSKIDMSDLHNDPDNPRLPTAIQYNTDGILN